MTGMADLGLTPEQERLYRRLLREPRTPPDPAADGPVLVQLRELGLVDAESTPVAPAAAVELLVRRRVEQTRRQLARLTSAWEVVAELSEEQRRGRPLQMIEHIQDGAAVTRRLSGMLDDEPREFMYMKSHARFPDPGDDGAGDDQSRFARALTRGLRSRTLFSAYALRDPQQADWARSWQARGDLHRVTTEPVRHLAIVNREVAFVQADPADPRAGALQIRHPGVVDLLAEYFDGLWNRARELDELPLTPIEQEVLHALVHHGIDEAAARSLHISVRKFRAHVADLMARLGAASRFQAAVRAKERGWL
ncbi:hypothetical protein [Streptomyces tritici]|uniref:helix-turn-helix transcriptional regulator n=1 Tax=Streptomyces tritici TaxID=2054410 RepID=UPI003AF12711